MRDLIGVILDIIQQSMPYFRMAWATIIVVGIVLVVLAAMLKKNPVHKRSPWICGGIGILMIASSGAQLLFSLI